MYMKLLISLVLLFGFNDCFAKYRVKNRKIEMSSSFDCNRRQLKHDCFVLKSAQACKKLAEIKKLNRDICGTAVNIYVYPKNIDKMIKENPEFKEDIMRETVYNSDAGYDEHSTNGYMYNTCRDEGEIVQISTCYNLWKYNPLGCDVVGADEIYQFQQHCNEIIKKVFKKTRKLY
jgi:hypothetical protein